MCVCVFRVLLSVDDSNRLWRLNASFCASAELFSLTSLLSFLITFFPPLKGDMGIPLKSQLNHDDHLIR